MPTGSDPVAGDRHAGDAGDVGGDAPEDATRGGSGMVPAHERARHVADVDDVVAPAGQVGVEHGFEQRPVVVVLLAGSQVAGDVDDRRTRRGNVGDGAGHGDEHRLVDPEQVREAVVGSGRSVTSRWARRTGTASPAKAAETGRGVAVQQAGGAPWVVDGQ